MRGVVAGPIAVALSAIIGYLLLPDLSSPKTEVHDGKKPGKVTEARAVHTNAVKRVERAVARVEGKTNRPSTGSGVRTNKVAGCYDAAEACRQARARGVRPLFKHQSDIWLSQFVTPGVRVPPIPVAGPLGEQFAESLLDPIRFDEEDSEHDKQVKQAVKDMRSEACKWIKDGGDFAGYMTEIQRRQNREADFVDGAKSIMMEEFRQTGDAEAAVEAWRVINRKLQSEGLRKVGLPGPIRIKLARSGREIPEE